MKKLAALIVLVVIGVATVSRLPGDIERLIADVIAYDGSAMTSAYVSAADVHIAPTSGKGSIRNLRIGNPAGFKTTAAFKAENIDLEIDMASIAEDVVVIRVILINGSDVNFEKGEAMTNFDVIQQNIANYVRRGAGLTQEPAKRLIIEELTICNSRAQASTALMGDKTISIPLPDITLRNIGKAKGGVTPAELGQEVIAALKAKLARSANFDRLLDSGNDNPVLTKSAERTLPK